MQSQAVSAETDNIFALAERAKDGDREAFMTITRMYQKNVFHLAYSFFQNREDALDIVQETFFRVYRKLHYYERGKSFKNWILQIAKNLCIDRYRKNHKTHDNKALNSEEIEAIHLTDEKGTERNQDTDTKMIVSKCLKELPERQRMIFVMKHYNDLKYTEIAETLGIAVGTVKSLNFKAVNKLRKLMNPYLGRQL
ncbi:MAG: sigma-70 family RNA polymerase sigma factor [Candidatus Aminicenantes bacterium]|nr:sigma-70 family RNA polymerase sigma factor [Candidatus Aminicenantes bacterium]